MTELQGYNVTEKIWESTRTVIYRGHKQGDTTSLMLKLPKRERPSSKELAKLEHEHRMLAELDHPRIIKTFGLVKFDRSAALVLEDFGGRSLNEFIGSPQLDLRATLRIGVALAQTLDAIHQANVIHKDIKPHNVVWNTANDLVKIIDFGVATHLGRETQQLVSPESLEGTIAYISPEQSGRMNRDIDYRTDLYSLGVTLYQMLTGVPPFQSNDALDLVYSHIARTPVPPSRRSSSVPEAVSNIVVKLLSKEPELRYQSGSGLAHDLALCLAQLEEKGTITPFALGREDVSKKLRIPQKLYGREPQIEKLMNSFERVRSGRSELVLISGPGGIGKSALVNEIHKAIAQEGGDFIAGKFDQLHRDRPFASFTQAFRDLVRQMLTQPTERLEAWKAQLLLVLRSNGQVLIDLIPELELVIGPQPAPLPLGPAESQMRFKHVFQSFVRVFCSASHPLVLFLDDLQWADPASLSLLPLLLADPESKHLLIVGAYRNQDVLDGHPLPGVIESLRKQEVSLLEMNLEPLDVASVDRLLQDTLIGADRTQVAALAEQIYGKTHGNPFFITQLLSAWHEAGLIQVDPSTKRWSWSSAAIAAAPVADNVVDFMAVRLKNFARETQRLLALAACIGHEFDLGLLSVVSEKTPADILSSIWPAMQEGLVVPLSSDYQLLQSPAEGPSSNVLAGTPEIETPFRFMHDRVQQAAYSLVDADHKQDVHLTVGRRLKTTLRADSRPDVLFKAINHLNAGGSRVTDPKERVEIARLNLDAGRVAKGSTAYAAAVAFFNAGLALLDASAWTSDYELMFSLNRERAECEYLAGSFDQAHAQLTALLEMPELTLLHRGELHTILIVVNVSQGKFVEGLTAVRSVLKHFGVTLPEERDEFIPAFIEEVRQIDESLANRSIESLLDAPRVSDPVHQMLFTILQMSSFVAFGYDPRLTAVISAKIVNLALIHGHVHNIPFVYAFFGVFLSGILARYPDAARFGQLALRLVDKLGAVEVEGKTNCIASVYSSYRQPIRNTIAQLERAKEACLQVMDLVMGSHSYMYSTLAYLRAGHSLEVVREEVKRGLALMRRTRDTIATCFLVGMSQLVDKLQGHPREPLDVSGDFPDMEKDQEDWIARLDAIGLPWEHVSYYFFKMLSCFWHGDYKQTLEMVGLVEKTLFAAAGNHWTTERHFHAIIAMTSLYASATPEERESYRASLAEHRAQLDALAENCPENELHRQKLAAAEMAAIAGDEIGAMNAYEEAISLARKNQFVQDEALANELCGRFYLSKGRSRAARGYLLEARSGYVAWGCALKLREFDEKYHDLRLGETSSGLSADPTLTVSFTAGTTTRQVSAGMLDGNTVIQATQAIASEIVLDNLIDRWMRIVAANAGAQRGTLMLAKGDRLVVVARIEVDPDQVKLGLSEPIEGGKSLPVSVVQYAARTKQPLVIDSPRNDTRFAEDPYLLEHDTKTIACIPLIHRNHLVGMLYLENNSLHRAFSQARVQLLSVLSGQAAISLENALLYADLEGQVIERTRELQEAQARVVQLEKEATELQMAGGFAHEMRNALTGAKLMLSKVFANNKGDGEWSACVDNSRRMRDLFMQVRETLPAERLKPTVEMLQAINQNEEVVHTALRGISGMLERGLSITSLLLSYAQLGSQQPGTSEVSASDLVTSLLKEYEDEFQAAKIQVSVQVPPSCVLIGEETNFYSIITNLVTNARDALMSVEGDARRRLQINVADEAARWVFTVVDNGIGIPDSIRDKIFEPFVSTKLQKGTGLGLGMVRKLVGIYRGTVEFESQEGHGATFRVILPKPASITRQ